MIETQAQNISAYICEAIEAGEELTEDDRAALIETMRKVLDDSDEDGGNADA